MLRIASRTEGTGIDEKVRKPCLFTYLGRRPCIKVGTDLVTAWIRHVIESTMAVQLVRGSFLMSALSVYECSLVRVSSTHSFTGFLCATLQARGSWGLVEFVI